MAQIPILSYCDNCGKNEAVVHVTLEARLVNHRSERTKIIQFWLCDSCEKQNRIFMENTYGQKERIARALCPVPTWWKEHLSDG